MDFFSGLNKCDEKKENGNNVAISVPALSPFKLQKKKKTPGGV